MRLALCLSSFLILLCQPQFLACILDNKEGISKGQYHHTPSLVFSHYKLDNESIVNIFVFFPFIILYLNLCVMRLDFIFTHFLQLFINNVIIV